jgi:hypothetical protein
MNVLPPSPDDWNCIEVDYEIAPGKGIAADKEFGLSEAQKVDTSRDCEMVYLRKL